MPPPALPRRRLLPRFLARLAAAMLVPAGVLLACFLLLRLLPGDPVAMQAAAPGLSPTDLDRVRAELGLDAPLLNQLGAYLGALGRGDLGRSTLTGRPVAAELAERLPASVELTLAGFAIATAAALPLGAWAALRRGGGIDRAIRLAGAAALALPSFLTGLGLIAVFYAWLGWAPEPVGRLDPFLAAPPRVTGLLTLDAALAGDGAAMRDALARLALPAATLAIFAFGPLVRITRAAVAAALAADYISAARANGLAPRRILWTYAMRNALAPVIGTLAMTFAAMLGAGVLVEKVFAWPGLGSFAVEAALALDHAALQGFVLVMAAVFVLVNLATDLAHAAIDPRIRPHG